MLFYNSILYCQCISGWPLIFKSKFRNIQVHFQVYFPIFSICDLKNPVSSSSSHHFLGRRWIWKGIRIIIIIIIIIIQDKININRFQVLKVQKLSLNPATYYLFIYLFMYRNTIHRSLMTPSHLCYLQFMIQISGYSNARLIIF